VDIRECLNRGIKKMVIMDKLIELIKAKVMSEGMSIDETIRYILELKQEIVVID